VLSIVNTVWAYLCQESVVFLIMDAHLAYLH
jgi:hypothetical protein